MATNSVLTAYNLREQDNQFFQMEKELQSINDELQQRGQLTSVQINKINSILAQHPNVIAGNGNEIPLIERRDPSGYSVHTELRNLNNHVERCEKLLTQITQKVEHLCAVQQLRSKEIASMTQTLKQYTKDLEEGRHLLLPSLNRSEALLLVANGYTLSHSREATLPQLLSHFKQIYRFMESKSAADFPNVGEWDKHLSNLREVATSIQRAINIQTGDAIESLHLTNDLSEIDKLDANGLVKHLHALQHAEMWESIRKEASLPPRISNINSQLDQVHEKLASQYQRFRETNDPQFLPKIGVNRPNSLVKQLLIRQPLPTKVSEEEANRNLTSLIQFVRGSVDSEQATHRFNVTVIKDETKKKSVEGDREYEVFFIANPNKAAQKSLNGKMSPHSAPFSIEKGSPNYVEEARLLALASEGIYPDNIQDWKALITAAAEYHVQELGGQMSNALEEFLKKTNQQMQISDFVYEGRIPAFFEAVAYNCEVTGLLSVPTDKKEWGILLSLFSTRVTQADGSNASIKALQEVCEKCIHSGNFSHGHLSEDLFEIIRDFQLSNMELPASILLNKLWQANIAEGTSAQMKPNYPQIEALISALRLIDKLYERGNVDKPFGAIVMANLSSIVGHENEELFYDAAIDQMIMEGEKNTKSSFISLLQATFNRYNEIRKADRGMAVKDLNAETVNKFRLGMIQRLNERSNAVSWLDFKTRGQLSAVRNQLQSLSLVPKAVKSTQPETAPLTPEEKAEQKILQEWNDRFRSEMVNVKVQLAGKKTSSVRYSPYEPPKGKTHPIPEIRSLEKSISQFIDTLHLQEDYRPFLHLVNQLNFPDKEIVQALILVNVSSHRTTLENLQTILLQLSIRDQFYEHPNPEFRAVVDGCTRTYSFDYVGMGAYSNMAEAITRSAIAALDQTPKAPDEIDVLMNTLNKATEDKNRHVRSYARNVHEALIRHLDYSARVGTYPADKLKTIKERVAIKNLESAE